MRSTNSTPSGLTRRGQNLGREGREPELLQMKPPKSKARKQGHIAKIVELDTVRMKIHREAQPFDHSRTMDSVWQRIQPSLVNVSKA